MRATKDLDVYVDPTPENLARLRHALSAFGAPQNIIAAADAPRTDATFAGFTFGRPPARVDILTRMEIPFAAIRERAATFPHETLSAVRVVGKDDLIELKRTANRIQDRHDLAALLPPPPPKRRSRVGG